MLPVWTRLLPLLICASAAAQTSVTGTVRDARTGEPLPGATVAVEGAGRGVTTQSDGTFAVAVGSGVVTLTASFVGYDPQSRTLADDARAQPVAFRLEPSGALLEEVVVGGASPVVAARPVQTVATQALRQVDPVDGRDVVELLPGAHLQVNSRGEALVYLRGSGERQTGLYLDGAPLLVPWDARFDAGLLPGWLVGQARVVQGPSSVLYGVGAPSGAVLLGTPRLSGDGRFVQLDARGAAPGGGRVASALASARAGRLQLDLGAGWTEQSADALADADLAFSQPSDRTRLNTDRQSVALYGRAERAGLSATVLHVRNEKGIAPESHVEAADARFWRYPATRYTLGTVRAQAQRASLGGTLRTQLLGWGQLHEQRIDQYEDAAFDRVVEAQSDDDVSGGVRAGLAFERPDRLLRVQLDALASQHDQADQVFPLDPRIDLQPDEQSYRVLQGGAGAEWEERIGARRRWVVGAGLGVEAIATPRTGDKPARDPQAAWTASATAGRQAGAGSVRLSAARKVRFPTLRELFGVALDRFLINPDLGPETIYQAELSGTLVATGWALDGALFARRTTNAIDQIRLTVDGAPLRQRVNLEGGRTLGASVSGRGRVGPVALSGSATAQQARGRDDGAWEPRVEVPAFTSFAAATYRAGSLSVGVDARTVAGARDAPGADGVRDRLPGGTRVGGRLAYTWIRGGGSLEAFARVDNAFDAAVFPQAGLPLPGRTFSLGLRVASGF